MADEAKGPLGRWEYLKKKSGYHFDKSIEESPFHIPGRFVGASWDEELRNVISAANGGNPYNFYFKVYEGESHTSHLDRNDMQAAGYKKTDYFVNKIGRPHLSRTSAPNLFKMIDWFELGGTLTCSLHIQRPGQVFPFHIDLLSYHRGPDLDHTEMDLHPEKWARFTVQLREWEWGHMWGIGNTYWKQWEAGEIMWHPWNSIPHGTANCGHSDRVSLQITGEVSEGTRKKMRLNKQSIDLASLVPGSLEVADG
jgi:hypothetical protein